MSVARQPSLGQAGAPLLVLASASPSRARMLAAAGVRVEQQAAAVDEAAARETLRADGVSAAEAAVALAELKARSVARTATADAVILGADQILTCADAWLAKADDRRAARAQLERLAGRRHELWTAAVAIDHGQRVWHHVSEARLWMRPCSGAFLDAYLEAVGEAALGSVGAYHVEGLGAQLLARVEGDHFAIRGLPLLEVLEFLRNRGMLMR